MKKLLLLISLFGTLIVLSQDQSSNTYNLMPWPKEITKTSAKFLINSDLTISIHGEDTEDRVRNVAITFLRRLAGRTGVFIDKGFPIYNKNAAIEISFNKVSKLGIYTDESYTLHVNSDKITINAATDIGAIRGLETLLQLTANNDSNYFFLGATIKDAPRFIWRGLMIDVARHFQPVAVIKRNLEAMASVKMNVFHWHLTDDQGFRVESKVYPKLQELASDGLYYTQEQIKDIIAYASKLGIRVVPEFDVPGHASAILAAYPELGSKAKYKYHIERFAGIFDPTLDPSKDITYTFLENLFAEITPLFPDDYFHIGGDENEGKHWNENKQIQEFKQKHHLKTNHDLQTYFNIKLEKILKKLGKKLMGWDEIMTPNTPTTAVIHSWRGEHEGLPKGGSLIKAAKLGYQTVLSNGYYIDRMLSVAHHYSTDPIGDIRLTKEERARILGGEATMWSELVTPLTIDSRIWPRTAAIAERFWSPKNITDISDMRRRLKTVSFHLEELGITHLKNRDVILRNMTNNQDISALVTLSKICEPLKIYNRNKGGTEYKSFSPFTLFADACTADAEDAISFNSSVNDFIESKNEASLNYIQNELKIWFNNHKAFLTIQGNPKIKPLENLSHTLSQTASILNNALTDKTLSLAQYHKLTNLMSELKKPYVDVELAIIAPLQKLINQCKTDYLN